MDSDQVAATLGEARANAREIERLRERSHEYGNALQATVAQLDAIDKKLDGIHLSVNGRIADFKADMKEDLREIKVETSETNGRVGEHDRQISRLQGGLIVLGAAVPVVTTLAVFLLPHISL